MGSLENFNICIIELCMLIPAIVIILILSFLEKRKFRQDLCGGRPGLPIPFRFLDGYENRTAYVVAFGTITSSIVSLIMSEPTLCLKMPLWAEALIVYLEVTVVCLICYPLFACQTTRYRASGAVLCILYSVLWVILKLVQLAHDLQQTAGSSGNSTQDNDTAFVTIMQVCQVLQCLPIIICYLVLIGYCIYILYRCYTMKIYFHIQHIKSTVKPHQEEYVRWVFRKFKITNQSEDSMNCNPLRWVFRKFKITNQSEDSMNCNPSQTFVNQMKDNIKLKYFTNFPFFKYPVKICALAFVQLIISYWATLLLVMKGILPLYSVINSVVDEELDGYELNLVTVFSVVLLFALVTLLVNSLAIFIGVRNYRYDILKIYHGDKSFVAVLNKTPQNILTRSMTFPGYQLGFTLWGTLLCFVTLVLSIFAVVLFIYIAARLDKLLEFAQVLIFPVIAIIVFYLQVAITKKYLLQEKVKETDKEPPLNVRNRDVYEVVNYYLLFINMAVGLLTCLFKILLITGLGIFFIARLDRSVFPQEMESWDRGHAAYLSMLLVDNAHNNPCMRVFAHLLWTKTLAARLRQVQAQEESSDVPLLVQILRPSSSTHTADILTEESPTTPSLSQNPWTSLENCGSNKSSQAITRWHLMYTLHYNKQLCELRKHKLARDLNSRRKSTLENDAQEEGNVTQTTENPILVDFDDSSSSTPNTTDSAVLLSGALGQQSSDSQA